MLFIGTEFNIDAFKVFLDECFSISSKKSWFFSLLDSCSSELLLNLLSDKLANADLDIRIEAFFRSDAQRFPIKDMRLSF